MTALGSTVRKNESMKILPRIPAGKVARMPAPRPPIKKRTRIRAMPTESRSLCCFLPYIPTRASVPQNTGTGRAGALPRSVSTFANVHALPRNAQGGTPKSPKPVCPPKRTRRATIKRRTRTTKNSSKPIFLLFTASQKSGINYYLSCVIVILNPNLALSPRLYAFLQSHGNFEKKTCVKEHFFVALAS